MKIFPTIFLVALASRQVFATTSSETIQQKFRNERRFTLYNSRKLEGKCIEVCEPPEETEAPTAALSTVSSMASSSASSTLSPTLSPTVTPKILDPTNRPSMKPTNEPTNKPTTEPTNKPTNKPTTEPTNKPTNKPTSEPTNKPTNKPTSEPTNKPTNKPTSEPTNKPTNKPTKSPTKEPTKSPTKAPTNQPTDAGPSYECVWPQAQYSAITKGDMINGAKNVYKKLAVGGSFINPSNSHVTVNGRVYYGNRIQGRVNYNGGSQKINDLADIPVDYEHYEWLARNLKSSNIGGKRVIVKTTGKDGKRNGCYSTYDFTPGGQGEDNGNTLVVFNTSDDICLTKTSDGRQFGPTVLAPFSKVTLTNSGYLDGTVIAKSFTTVVGNNKGTEQQLHGDNYKGQIECIEPETAKPTNEPTASPTELPERSVPVPDGCACEAGDQSLARSWKCGNDVYVCPGMTHICKNSPSQNSLFYSITEEQCDAMKLVQLGDKCVALPQYELDQPKGLSHRVCYDGEGLPVKEDGQCEECQGLVDIAFEPTAAPVNDTEQDDGACGCETGSDADSSWRCGKHVYVCPNVEKVCSSQGRTVSEYFKLTQAQCDEMKTKSLGDKCVQIAADGMNKRNMISRVCYNNKTTGVHGMLQAKDQECKFCKDSFSPTLKSSNRLLSALENAMNAFSSTSN